MIIEIVPKLPKTRNNVKYVPEVTISGLQTSLLILGIIGSVLGAERVDLDLENESKTNKH